MRFAKLFLILFLLGSPILSATPTPKDQINAAKISDFYLHVMLTGIVKYIVFPGPPNFVSVEKGDYEEPRWILEVDAPSLKRLVEIQRSATPNNYAYRYLDTTLEETEPNANLVTLDSSFTGEPDDHIELYENKMVTIDAVISAQPAHCHTPFVVEIAEIISHE